MFKYRSSQKEIMDDLQISSEIGQTLKELDVINRRLGGNKVTINALEKIYRRENFPQQITIADLGCGGGDILITIAKWAQKKGIKAELYGIDANPNIIEFAKDHSKNYPEISYKVVNIFSKAFQTQKYDIITCSLFTHHFTNNELVQLFSQVKQQCKYFIVNDLHRHPFAFYSIKFLTQLFSKSVMVRNDAPISVLRGFIRKELEDILKASDIKKYQINWMWAFRWQLVAQFS